MNSIGKIWGVCNSCKNHMTIDEVEGDTVICGCDCGAGRQFYDRFEVERELKWQENYSKRHPFDAEETECLFREWVG